MNMSYDNFEITFNKLSDTLYFKGVLRSNNFAEFDKIEKFILDVYDLETPKMIMDFTELEFMNSAGISTICRFVLDAKEKKYQKSLEIIGRSEILWQVKSFENLKKIWDSITLKFI